MYVYEEALARYAGPHITTELEQAMVAVQEQHHNELMAGREVDA